MRLTFAVAIARKVSLFGCPSRASISRSYSSLFSIATAVHTRDGTPLYPFTVVVVELADLVGLAVAVELVVAVELADSVGLTVAVELTATVD